MCTITIVRTRLHTCISSCCCCWWWCCGVVLCRCQHLSPWLASCVRLGSGKCASHVVHLALTTHSLNDVTSSNMSPSSLLLSTVYTPPYRQPPQPAPPSCGSVIGVRVFGSRASVHATPRYSNARLLRIASANIIASPPRSFASESAVASRSELPQLCCIRRVIEASDSADKMWSTKMHL